MKKRGFGKGKWNGVGGKKEDGETLLQAAAREVEEEIGVEVQGEDFEERGTLLFSFEGDAQGPFLVHVFFVYRWSGEPTESEEMAPRWYSIDTVPYKDMWVDDEHWLPGALAEEVLKRHFHLSATGDEIISMD